MKKFSFTGHRAIAKKRAFLLASSVWEGVPALAAVPPLLSHPARQPRLEASQRERA